MGGAPSGQLTQAEGQGLRAIRMLLFEHDRLRAFGGLRRVQALGRGGRPVCRGL